MENESLVKKNDSLRGPLILSAAGHLLIFSFLFLKTVFFPSEPIIVQNAIRVDLIGLPEKETPKVIVAKPIATEPTPASKPKPKPTKKLPPKKSPSIKSQQKDAFAKIKAMSAIEKLRQKLKNQANKTKAAPIKGNKIAKGSSLTGLDKIEHGEYLAKLEVHMKQYWDLPQWLADANLKAQIRVAMDERGYVIKKELIKSSGNEIFDEHVIKAVTNSSPFPHPPKRLQALLESDGMIVNFP